MRFKSEFLLNVTLDAGTYYLTLTNGEATAKNGSATEGIGGDFVILTIARPGLNRRM
jgi:hypothetical protein